MVSYTQEYQNLLEEEEGIKTPLRLRLDFDDTAPKGYDRFIISAATNENDRQNLSPDKLNTHLSETYNLLNRAPGLMPTPSVKNPNEGNRLNIGDIQDALMSGGMADVKSLINDHMDAAIDQSGIIQSIRNAHAYMEAEGFTEVAEGLRQTMAGWGINLNKEQINTIHDRGEEQQSIEFKAGQVSLTTEIMNTIQNQGLDSALALINQKLESASEYSINDSLEAVMRAFGYLETEGFNHEAHEIQGILDKWGVRVDSNNLDEVERAVIQITGSETPRSEDPNQLYRIEEKNNDYHNTLEI